MAVDSRNISLGNLDSKTGADYEQPSVLGASILGSEELQFINEHHNFSLSSLPDETGGARPTSTSPLSPFLSKLSSSIRVRLRQFLLGDYFLRERDYQAHLVRHLNSMARTIETKEMRLSDDHWMSQAAIEKKLLEQIQSLRRELAEERANTSRMLHDQEARLASVQSVALGLERLLMRANTSGLSHGGAEGDVAARSEHRSSADLGFDPTYLLLENRFRGDESEISKRLQSYESFFSSATQPVVEVGAGRGELQRIFRKAGISSYALEIDEGMVNLLSGEGFDVRAEDALSHFSSLPEKTLGGVVAIQVVEHLPTQYLRKVFIEIHRVLGPQGKFVFETINTRSVLALAHNYFRDPTHQAPMHPDTMRFLLEIAGFEVLAFEELSPYPDEATLQPLRIEGFMSPRWREFVEVMNRNFAELNRLLYGCQDYRIVAIPK